MSYRKVASQLIHENAVQKVHRDAANNIYPYFV